MRGYAGPPGTKYWVGVPSRSLEEAALLVLLARPARTRVIASHLCSSHHARLARRGLAIGAVYLAPSALRRDRRGGCGRGSQVRAADPHLEELLEDDLLEVVHHFLEHVEG